MALSFALEREGFTEGTLETLATVVLDKQGDGFSVTRSDLELTTTVPGIDEARFAEIAEHAKKTCPISKLLNRSEEHTSELQSLMRISYAVFCLKKKNKEHKTDTPNQYFI